MAAMVKINVQLGPRSYAVQIGDGLLSQVGALARAAGARGVQALLITDENTARFAEPVADGLVLEQFRTTHVKVPVGETTKNLEEASQLYDALAERQADRQTLVVALGGGVVGDLAGFVAATYMRGLPWIVIPTTLVAMVDSSIGGKVGVNHAKGKNLIGAFHQPLAVITDLDVLKDLPDRDYRSGLAEVVKYGFSMDAKFFARLENASGKLLARDQPLMQEAIVQCAKLKAHIVAEDERETLGRRMVLNFGHTFAHAFETVGGYGAWKHGEAVAAGMICACRLAERLGMLASAGTERLTALLTAMQLPTRPEAKWPIAELVAVMRSDKKTQAGRLRFVLPTGPGHVEVVSGVDDEQVMATLRDLGGR
jgi:3-dehydroquinate synthase